MLQLASLHDALVPGSDPLIRLISILFTIVGGGMLFVIYRKAATGVYRVWWYNGPFAKKYTDFRRADDPYLFWGHVVSGATFAGLFFLIGLAGIILELFRL